MECVMDFLRHIHGYCQQKHFCFPNDEAIRLVAIHEIALRLESINASSGIRMDERSNESESESRSVHC